MKPTQPQIDEYIYTDGVDYSKTSDDSVWGTEEEITSKIIKDSKISDKWLNLCAGDGRFNNTLLEYADELIAADIDEIALQKLVRIAPQNLKEKLSTKTINVTAEFPFQSNTFDGIFCTGTLHLFPREIFRTIFSEIERVLKPGGRIIIDFAVDIKRVCPDGSLWIVKNEPNYSLKEAQDFLGEVFHDYKTQMYIDKTEPEEVTLNDRTYKFSCNFILLTAIKK